MKQHQHTHRERDSAAAAAAALCLQSPPTASQARLSSAPAVFANAPAVFANAPASGAPEALGAGPGAQSNPLVASSRHQPSAQSQTHVLFGGLGGLALNVSVCGANN